jgi:prepilin-type N-terminal cleavage/methylation domain-containing protein
MKNTSGFTLIEVLVAATIVAVLSAGAMVSFASVNVKSRDSRRSSDIEQMRSALEMFRADNGQYINSTGDVAAALNVLKTNSYIEKIPSDPKTGNPVYRYSSAGATYTICALMENAPVASTLSCAADMANCGSTSYNYCAKNP